MTNTLLGLLISITPLALFDMLSILPVNSAVLMSQMRGKRPTIKALIFLLGFFAASMLGGLLVAFGMRWLFALIPELLRSFLVTRSTVVFGLQLVLGIAMVVGSGYVQTRRERIRQAQNETIAENTPDESAYKGSEMLKIFSIGFTFSAAGLPSGFTYFLAIDQILKFSSGIVGIVFFLTYYNLIVLGPLFILVFLASRFPALSQALVDRIEGLAKRWTPKVLQTILITIGAVFAIDAIIFFVHGSPLFSAS